MPAPTPERAYDNALQYYNNVTDSSRPKIRTRPRVCPLLVGDHAAARTMLASPRTDKTTLELQSLAWRG